MVNKPRHTPNPAPPPQKKKETKANQNASISPNCQGAERPASLMGCLTSTTTERVDSTPSYAGLKIDQQLARDQPKKKVYTVWATTKNKGRPTKGKKCKVCPLAG